MALDSNEYIRRLQEKYPIGNCEHFPHMRVLTQAVGGRVLYLELTLARIQIWANYLVCYLIICFEQDVDKLDIIQAMERDGVTLQVPPNSIHFDAKACMKPPKTANAVPVIAPEGQNPAPVPQVQVQPAAYPPFHPWMYQYHPQSYPPQYTYPPGAPHQHGPNYHHPGPVLQNNSPFSSPGQALRLRVALEDFCSRYEISKADKAKLATLEYKPGNNAVLKLERVDWKEVGFTSLGWQAFLDAHRHFIRDVRAGVWDHPA
jgi:hypothetical protein